jgi:transglycosylase-like protein with SLT domain
MTSAADYQFRTVAPVSSIGAGVPLGTPTVVVYKPGFEPAPVEVKVTLVDYFDGLGTPAPGIPTSVDLGPRYQVKPIETTLVHDTAGDWYLRPSDTVWLPFDKIEDPSDTHVASVLSTPTAPPAPAPTGKPTPAPTPTPVAGPVTGGEFKNAAAAALVDPSGVSAVLAAFQAADVPPAEADRIVSMESAWNPSARNPVGGAVGLLQWMPSIVATMPGNPTPAQVQAMSRRDQASLIAWSYRAYHRMRAGDAYLWNFTPAYFSKPASTVIYPVGSTGWKDNAGFREPGDGPITVRRVLAIGSGSETPGGAAKPASQPSGGKMVVAVALGVVGVVGLAWVARPRV